MIINKEIEVDLNKVNKNYCCNCGGDGGRDCSYGYHDSYNGEFECLHPDASKLECPCYETWCDVCRVEYIKKSKEVVDD